MLPWFSWRHGNRQSATGSGPAEGMQITTASLVPFHSSCRESICIKPVVSLPSSGANDWAFLVWTKCDHEVAPLRLLPFHGRLSTRKRESSRKILVKRDLTGELTSKRVSLKLNCMNLLIINKEPPRWLPSLECYTRRILFPFPRPSIGCK